MSDVLSFVNLLRKIIFVTKKRLPAHSKVVKDSSNYIKKSDAAQIIPIFRISATVTNLIANLALINVTKSL